MRASLPLRGLMEVDPRSYVADECGARKGTLSVEGVVGMVVKENEGVVSERIEQAGWRGGERMSGRGRFTRRGRVIPMSGRGRNSPERRQSQEEIELEITTYQLAQRVRIHRGCPCPFQPSSQLVSSLQQA